MHEPVIKESNLKKICRKIVSICEHWLVKQFLRPIVFLLPPMLITMIATRKGLQDDAESLVGQGIGVFLNSSALLVIVGAYIYVVAFKALYAAIETYAKPEKELEVKDVFAILKSIEIVVEDKTKRMANEAKKAINSASICGKSTFLQITRPDQQIPLLVRGIRTVFEYMDSSKANFRVGLLKIENDKPIDWYSFEPISCPPRTQATGLQSPTSTVSRCIKTRSLIVIDNIQKELTKKTKKERRFVKGNVQESEEGSQLCYPVIHPATGNVEYVITIAGNRADCLVEKCAELYDWIIKQFAVRISIEHSLLLMKEKANESETAA